MSQVSGLDRDVCHLFLLVLKLAMIFNRGIALSDLPLSGTQQPVVDLDTSPGASATPWMDENHPTQSLGQRGVSTSVEQESDSC